MGERECSNSSFMTRRVPTYTDVIRKKRRNYEHCGYDTTIKLNICIHIIIIINCILNFFITFDVAIPKIRVQVIRKNYFKLTHTVRY